MDLTVLVAVKVDDPGEHFGPRLRGSTSRLAAAVPGMWFRAALAWVDVVLDVLVNPSMSTTCRV